MAVDVKAIAAAKLLKLQNKGKGENAGKFWKIPDGKSVVRIVPDKSGDSYRSYEVHYSVGKEHAFLCPKKMFGEHCPCCEWSWNLYSEGTEDTKKLAKKLMPAARFCSPVIVRSEEEKGIQFWSYSKKVYETLLGYVLNPDYGDISDPETGIDLDISYGKASGADFPTTTITPRRKESPLLADKKAAKAIIDQECDYSHLFNRLTSEQVGQALDRMLTGNAGNEEIVKGGKSDSTVSDVDKAFAAATSEDEIPY